MSKMVELDPGVLAKLHKEVSRATIYVNDYNAEGGLLFQIQASGENVIKDVFLSDELLQTYASGKELSKYMNNMLKKLNQDVITKTNEIKARYAKAETK